MKKEKCSEADDFLRNLIYAVVGIAIRHALAQTLSESFLERIHMTRWQRAKRWLRQRLSEILFRLADSIETLAFRVEPE